MEIVGDLDTILEFVNADNRQCELYCFMVSHMTLEIRVKNTDTKESKYLLLEGVEYLRCPTKWESTPLQIANEKQMYNFLARMGKEEFEIKEFGSTYYLLQSGNEKEPALLTEDIVILSRTIALLEESILKKKFWK